MTSERDDALQWDGDDDPTLDPGASASPGLPAGFAAVGKGSETLGVADGEKSGGAPAASGSASTTVEPSADGDPTVDSADEQPALGNAALVTLGVLGGFYALFTIGWVIGGLRLQGVAQYLVADVMFVGSFWLAVMAPAIWFGTTFLLTRGSASWLRITWLLAGFVLLVPWPFVMIGAWGQ